MLPLKTTGPCPDCKALAVLCKACTKEQTIPYIPTPAAKSLQDILRRDARSGSHLFSIAHAAGVYPT